MDFERDLFISYTHDDNATLYGDEGWVDTLHKGLDIRLTQLLGRKPSIWRDIEGLQGNSVLEDSIFEEFPKLALLVSVLSPRYMESWWCQEELKHFLEAVQVQGGLKIPGTTRKRIFKVVKTHLDRAKHPTPIKDMMGYEFYEFNSEGRFREFDVQLGEESRRRKFFEKLDDLAQDIHKTLEVLQSLSQELGPGHRGLPDTEQFSGASKLPAHNIDGSDRNPSPIQPGSSKTIYLAETTPELVEDRDMIRRELEQAGHLILPEAPLPQVPTDFEQSVRLNLLKSSLSVHLVSPYPLRYLNDEEPTDEENYRQLQWGRTRKQIALAQETCDGNRQFSPIFWMPHNSGNLKQDDFVTQLEIVKSTREALKDIILTKIISMELPPETESTGRRVYLDYTEQDSMDPHLQQLYEWLLDQFDEVVSPGQVSSLSQSQELLGQCEAALIYCGNSTVEWIKARLKALMKASYRPSSPKSLLAKALYTTSPDHKKFRPPGITLIEGLGSFDETLLSDFIKPLKMGG
jgi:hypothetical protein